MSCYVFIREELKILPKKAIPSNSLSFTRCRLACYVYRVKTQAWIYYTNILMPASLSFFFLFCSTIIIQFIKKLSYLDIY
jgi:hypothetical protein